MQALDPLAVALVGLGPSLDLLGELGRGGDDVQAGFQQGEEQDVAVDAGGLQGDGGDAAMSQPGDELTQAGGVGGELADGIRAVGRTGDAGPVAGVADIDAGGVGVVDGQGGQLGGLPGLARGLVEGAARGGGVGNDHEILYNSWGAGGRDEARRGGSAEEPSRPNGIDRVRACPKAVVTKRKGRKRPPSQSNQRAER